MHHTHDLVALYQRGEKLADLSARFGISPRAVYHRLDAAGVSRRNEKLTRPRRRHVIDVSELTRRYHDGESVNALAHAFNCARSVIRRHLKRAGVVLRGQSQAEAVKWRRMDATARARQVAAAHTAARGVPQPLDRKRKGALTRFIRGCFIHRFETPLANELRARGLQVAQQFPVEQYSIDVALPEHGIAVEICVNTMSAKYRPIFARKCVELLDRDWCLVIAAVLVRSDCREPNIAAIADHVVTLAERARRGEALGGQYRVIRGDGQTRPPARYEVHDRPLVPAP